MLQCGMIVHADAVRSGPARLGGRGAGLAAPGGEPLRRGGGPALACPGIRPPGGADAAAAARHRGGDPFVARSGAAAGAGFLRDRPGPAGPRLHRSAARCRPVAARHGPGRQRPRGGARPAAGAGGRPFGRRGRAGADVPRRHPRAPPAGRLQRRPGAAAGGGQPAVSQHGPAPVPQPLHPEDLRLDGGPVRRQAADRGDRLAPRSRRASISTGGSSPGRAMSAGRSA